MEILVRHTKTAAPLRFRLVAKHSRYFKARYWVVIPRTGARTERWRLVPDLQQAVGMLARRLLAEANCCFGAESPAADAARQEAPDSPPDDRQTETNLQKLSPGE